MAHERAAGVRPPLHRDVHPALDQLRHDLGQEIGFREVFRADDDAVVPGTGAEQRRQGEEHPTGYRCHASLRSAIPSAASAARASSAAGNAPAMISVSSTVATPRKMYTPSPPAPIAAPIVATPTLTTVATRMPARITPAASGSSTSRSSSRSVMPMPRPASRTAGSTPAMPVYVFRMIGSSA